uniref:TAL1 (SCL) interrupting locus n=1 Tax=Nothobranchius rachovii TaxID=451742 RepID=A0A1A8NUR0_9TELE
MSYPVNLQALPREVLEEVFSPGNMRGRNSVNSFTQLSFPKSRSALWDGSPAGDKLRLQLCCHRKPRVVLLEKALRLALRHARHSNRPRLQCFFLGSVSVDPDEEGITVNLDRFDPGRDQGGAAGRVPSALLPRDVPVPCLFSVQSEAACDVQSEAELRQSFKALQQAVSSRLSLDLSQLLRIRAQVACSQTSDAAALTLSWVAVCPAVSVDVQPVRAIPIIPTALLRSLTSIGHSPQTGSHQRGFLTMDHTRKLVLLLESDPKACSLPLVGLWLSGVTHVYNPQVWARCVRFMFSSALQDRVLSESGCFLLVVFGSTHRTPQFFQCRGPGPEPQLDFQLLTASQSASLYQAAPVPGRVLQCELGLEDLSRQAEVFRASQKSFSSSPPPADRQLRLLQAQIQMLLEAQGKIPVDTQTSTSTASIAVETGASLFWGGNPEHRDELPGPGPSSSSSLSSSSHDLSVRSPAGGPEEEKVRSTEVSCSASDHHSISSPQSPVLGESVSMYGPPEEQQSFYQNLMTRLNSRLQESHHNQEAEDESRRSSVSASQSSQSKPLQQKKSANADPVVRATLRQLQQLGVDVDQKDLMESNLTRAVENASTLASINPAAVVSRLGVSDLTSGALLPGGSVDLSLEANAIALRYLTDSQLNKLSLGGHAPQHVTSSTDSLLSPSNMSLATRKYMRRYGLIEEEEEQEEEVRGQEARQPLSDALNVRLLPQSQLIRDLRPKMQLLTGGTKPDSGDKENRSGRRNSLVRAGSREPEGSLGNILDLSRLRQLPKLF